MGSVHNTRKKCNCIYFSFQMQISVWDETQETCLRFTDLWVIWRVTRRTGSHNFLLLILKLIVIIMRICPESGRVKHVH